MQHAEANATNRVRIPDKHTPYLRTEEKVAVKYLYPNAKSNLDAQVDDDDQMKKRLKMVKRNLQSDRVRLARLGGYMSAAQYQATGSVEHRGTGYMSAAGVPIETYPDDVIPDSGSGYIAAPQYDAKKGGAVIATLAGLAAAGLISGATSTMGSHIYSHIAPVVEKVLSKFSGRRHGGNDPESSDDFASNKPIKEANGAILATPLQNATPLQYWKGVFTDVSNAMKNYGYKKSARYPALSHIRGKIFGGSLNMKIDNACGDPSEGGVRKHLKYRHIALPVIHEYLKQTVCDDAANCDPSVKQQLQDETIRISKLIPSKKISMGDNQMRELRKCLKVTGSGAHRMIPKSLTRRRTDNMISKIKKSTREYLSDIGIDHNTLNLKKVRDGADFLRRIEESRLTQPQKHLVRYVAAQRLKNRFAGSGVIPGRILAHLQLNAKDPRHVYMITKELKKLGTTQQIVKSLKNPKSLLHKLSEHYLVGGAAMLVAIILLHGLARYISPGYRTKSGEMYGYMRSKMGKTGEALERIGVLISDPEHPLLPQHGEETQTVSTREQERLRDLPWKEWATEKSAPLLASSRRAVRVPREWLTRQWQKWFPPQAKGTGIMDKYIDKLDLNVSPKTRELMNQHLADYRTLMSVSDIKKAVKKHWTLWQKLRIPLGLVVALILLLAYRNRPRIGQPSFLGFTPTQLGLSYMKPTGMRTSTEVDV